MPEPERPEQREAVAGLDLEVDAVERAHLGRAAPVDDRDPLAGRQRLARSPGPAVAHLDHAVDGGCDAQRMGDDDDGGAEVLAQRAQRLEHRASLRSSSSAVGSSASTSGASRAAAAAIATRCCSPPESEPARWPPRPPSPNAASADSIASADFRARRA